MNETENHRLPILAAGDESHIKDFYHELIGFNSRHFQPETNFDWTMSALGSEAVEMAQKTMVQGNPFAVALIHFPMGNKIVALETVERIRKIDPGVNFVTLSESADGYNEVMGRVPPANKILFVQKPFQSVEVFQFAATMATLWQSQKELQRVSCELLDINSQLMETNEALSVLARNLESSRRESENRMVQRIRTLIIPVIQKLQQERGLKRFKTDLDLLIGYIESLSADLESDLDVAAVLSKKELQVASLIKNGMTSDEIAAHLNVSLFTVKTHRKNIRKKLDIQNSGVNLRSYLDSDVNG